MAARPEAKRGIVILYERVAWHELLVALVDQERAIKGWRFDGRGCWRRLGHPLRQGSVAEPLRNVVHRWREDQGLNRRNDHWGGWRSQRRGWPGEFKAP